VVWLFIKQHQKLEVTDLKYRSKATVSICPLFTPSLWLLWFVFFGASQFAKRVEGWGGRKFAYRLIFKPCKALSSIFKNAFPFIINICDITFFCSSPNIIRTIKSRRMRWAGHVARMGGKRNAYRILVGKPEGRRPLGRPRRRWVDNIKVDLREIGWDCVDWVDLSQDWDHWRRALVNTVMNLRVP
jgi:hypothetical protein